VAATGRRALAAVAAAMTFATAAQAQAATTGAAAGAPPSIGAPAAILVDAHTGAVLYAKSPDSRRPIASTTKLMTAALTLARAKPDQVFAAPAYSPQQQESTIGLAAGERMSVHDLMRALLLASANDAAATLARGVGGTQRRFVEEMNAEARRIGLTGTSYANPVGLDSPHNYSTARDLAKLASRLILDPRFASIVRLPRATLRTGIQPRVVLNRNKLIGAAPFVDGVKTGHTQKAGYVLVGGARRGFTQVVSVVLGEPSEAARDTESLTLLRYGLSQFQEVRPVSRQRTLALVPVNWFDGLHISLRAARDVRLSVRRGAVVRTSVRLPFPMHLTGPLPRGSRVGSVTVLVDGRRRAKVPLITVEATPSAGFVRRAAVFLGRSSWTVDLGLVGIALLLLFRARSVLRTGKRGKVRT
jgi:D-alanyl-D-alanine carboxypeptidase (penicillin-binding protein 5/6)